MSSDKPIEICTPPEAEDAITCRLCRRQFAKYTCATCNVPYCSLMCFRSQAHSLCSEGFYRKEIESDIRSGSSKTTEERQKMMELLRKFEDETINDEDFLIGKDVDEVDPSGLASRFAGIDIDSASSDAIWSMLTPEERNKFTKALEDPSSQLAQELLASERLEKEIKQPWWKAPVLDEDGLHRFGSKPEMLEIPPSMIQPIPVGHPLVYNTCALCLAYAYVTRNLGVSPLCSFSTDVPEYHEARVLFKRLVPFATETKSTKLYPSLPALITEFWSLFAFGEMTNSLLSMLLRDAAFLLTPLRVTELSLAPARQPDLSSHPLKTTLLALSDLHAFYSKGGTGKSSNWIDRKLLFYAAHISSTPTAIMEDVAKETLARAKHYEALGVDGDVTQR